ncbi:MAG: hypothetical protein ACTHMZ_08540 [Actinomycetes bacterium]
MTFGPVGRVGWSVALFIPLWWFLWYAGLFGIVGAVIWGFIVVPWGLRDLWRSVPRTPGRRRPTAVEELEERYRREQAVEQRLREAAPIEDRKPPRRW